MTGEEIKALAKREVKGEHKEVQKYENQGRFLPLGVWGTQGYEVDKIKANAQPEDMKWNEKWKWAEYRVPVEMDSKADEDIVSDAVKLSSRGQVHKRRRTAQTAQVEDAAQPTPASPWAEPPDEDSGSDEGDSDDRESSSKPTRRIGKGKGKAKSKAKAKPKAKAVPKTVEQLETIKKAKALKNKVAAALKAFRETTKHQHILDVAQPIIDVAKGNIAMLSELQERLDASSTSGLDDTCVESAEALDWAKLKAADRALRDALKLLEKAQDKPKKQQKK